MYVFPAIDLVDGKAVRLLKGDYDKMTVYSEHPEETALDFRAKGVSHIHIVDLEGARDGNTPNFDTVCRIKNESGLFCEIGGGIRSMDVVDKYMKAGIDRVILGTAAVKDEAFLREALLRYGEKIAVGVDIRDGFVAVRGWLEKTEFEAMEFCRKMKDMGVKTLICTDISKDGAMQGTNRGLYKKLKEELCMDITASGGVSTMDDVSMLARMDVYGIIIGKAYYTGAIDLKQAVEMEKQC